MPKYQVIVTEIWTSQWVYEVEAESSEEAQTLGHDLWEEETNHLSEDESRGYLEYVDAEVDVFDGDEYDDEELEE